MPTDAGLPPSWNLLPTHLQKAFWTIREAAEGTGYSRSSISRFRDDPESGFPRGRVASTARGNGPNKGKVILPAVQVLAWMEGTD